MPAIVTSPCWCCPGVPTRTVTWGVLAAANGEALDASTGDGILTSLKIMEVMMAKKQPLSELHKELTIYPQVLKNVRVTDKRLAQDDPDVQAAVAEVAAKLGDSGRILVRESGTEPLVRVMVEAETEEKCQEYVDFVVETIQKKGHAV